MEPEQAQQPSYPTGSDLLRVTATAAGYTFALASLTLEQGPTVQGVRVLPATFLLFGLPLVVATLMAMCQVFADARMGWADLVRYRPPDAPIGREALVALAWGLILLLVAYVVLLYVAAT